MMKVCLYAIVVLTLISCSNNEKKSKNESAELEINKKETRELLNSPKDFPLDYIVEGTFCLSCENPDYYIFYKNGDYQFIYGGKGELKKYDFGVWHLKNDTIFINVSLRLGLRGIGEPLNPEVHYAANPDDYYTYKELQKYENWISINKKLDVNDFQISNMMKLNDSTKLEIDISKFLINGKYKKASCIVLDEKEFVNLETRELRLMRNEIFARYGYIFKSDDLKEYFGLKKWYNPEKINIDEYLTEIEKTNIKLIKKYEN